MNKQIRKNKLNTILAIAGFLAVICLIGGFIAYYYNNISILIWFTVISVGYTAFQYFFATKESVFLSGAKEIQKSDNPNLYGIIEKLTRDEKLPMPRVFIINDPAPNAFASGRDPKHSLVAVSTGLLKIMEKDELSAVIAHELSHIKNYDIRLTMVVFGLTCLVGLLSDLGFRLLFYGRSRRSGDEERSPIGFLIIIISAVLAPIAASFAQMAISREREYLADASAAKATNPDSMISVLKKLDIHGRPMRSQNSATEPMYINDPLKKGFFSNLFSTHPPIEKRIARLENAKKK